MYGCLVSGHVLLVVFGHRLAKAPILLSTSEVDCEFHISQSTIETITARQNPGLELSTSDLRRPITTKGA